MATDSVNFINEDDTGRILLALLEKITDAACANTDEHLDEIRTGDGEERYVGFAGDRAGEQSLAGAWRSDEQDALRNTAAKLLEFLRILQELDDFLQLFFGFVGPSNVLKGGFLLLRGKETSAGLAEAESFVAAGLHLAHQEQAEADEKNQRRSVEENQNPVATANILYLALDRSPFALP